MVAAKRSPKGAGFVRIIGGSLRGRRLEVPEVVDLRPSPDRVRVTLFNWLALYLPGSRCLDLYAGSGVLGFEALSRGAARAVFVERSPVAVAALSAQRLRLGVVGAEVVAADVALFLRQPAQLFDVVFLDPPFQQRLGGAALASLAQGWVASTSFVYWESAAGDPEAAVGAPWQVVRDKTVAGVRSRLLRWTPCLS